MSPMTNPETQAEFQEGRARWLLLIHQLPAKPAYQRVKTWRRLQGLGAVAIKNAVHALPVSEQAQEDFEWLLREIRDGGGEALICEARLVDGLSDEEVQSMFNAARETRGGQGQSRRRCGVQAPLRAAAGERFGNGLSCDPTEAVGDGRRARPWIPNQL